MATVSPRPIELRLLQTFVTVATEGNVSRASEKLFLSQPAVSQQLKELGRLTGLTLLKRTAGGMVLTREGSVLLAHAERLLEGAADFSIAAQRLARGAGGRLRIGTILDREFTRLGAFLHELVNHAPEIEPELQHGTSGAVLARLLAREIDVGYYVGDAQADAARAPRVGRAAVAVHVEALTRFTYRVIAPRGWGPRVLGRDWVDLVRLPWILTPPDSVHARLLAEVLAPLGLKQQQVALVDQEASMLALVRSGVGLSLARDAIAIRESQSEGLVVADRVQLETSLSFVCRSAARRTPVVEAALAALGRAWRR